MKLRLLSIATVSIVALISIAAAFPKTRNHEDTHEYTLGVVGDEGGKLRMTIVSKSSARSAPKLEVKDITIPFETKFKASTFYVWFQTTGGAEDMDVYKIRSVYKIDGELQGTGFGLSIGKGKKMTTGFGNL